MRMKIETNNLILRKLLLKDIKDLIENGNDKEISRLTLYMPFPLTEKEAKKIIKDNDEKLFRFGVYLKKEAKIIGVIDIYSFKKQDKKAKLGYWIGKNYRGKGYASEAIEKIIEFAFKKLKIENLFATTLDENIISKNFLKKMNFKEVEFLKNDRIIDGKYLDTVKFSLNKQDFWAKQRV